MTQSNELFRRFAHKTSELAGTPWAFILAFGTIVVWATSGPIFKFSDTWQLVINTSTTIVTFLMVFLIQNTQNRDAKAIHLKLDELIRAVEGARNTLVDLEDMSDEELGKLQRQFEKLSARARLNVAMIDEQLDDLADDLEANPEGFAPGARARLEHARHDVEHARQDLKSAREDK
jgi:low affinity Fe/Cu permease